MSSKWRIYCRDPSHEGFQTVWSDEAPVICPVNASHEINPNSISIVAREVLTQTVTPPYSQTRSLYYIRAATLLLDPRDSPIRRITVFANVDPGAGGYSIELYNSTTHTSLAEITKTNTTLEEATLPSIVLDEGINKIDVNVKYEKGSSQSKKYYVYLDKICVYSEQ